MNPAQLRNPDDTRQWLLQGAWLARTARPTSMGITADLNLAYRLAADGLPLLPLGVLADWQRLLVQGESTLLKRDMPSAPEWPPAHSRGYEDHVLGRIVASTTMERAIDALRLYTPEQRNLGFAFIVRRICELHPIQTVEIAPGILRTIVTERGETLLSEGYESFATHGVQPLLLSQYESLIAAFRRAGDLLNPDDVQALEQRTALATMSRYIAHRQVVRLMAEFAAGLPQRPPSPAPGRREVPTRIHDDDQYPVGGYSSISTRGSIESLLHSQLAYMEDDQRPDLFDIKFVRDELYYDSRDENQFLRRRRAFGIRFQNDLVQARVKDADLPAQRGVLALALVLTVIKTLADWLATDALKFSVVFDAGLEDDAEIAAIVLHDLVERDVVSFEKDIASWREIARTAQMHTLTVGVSPVIADVPQTVGYAITVDSPRPLLHDDQQLQSQPDHDPTSAWQDCLLDLLRRIC